MKIIISFMLFICVLAGVCGFTAGDALAGVITEPTRTRYIPEELFSDTSRLADALSGTNKQPLRVPIDPSLPMIALTFDDGPTKTSTNKILDVLEEYNIVATFFVVGNIIERNSETLLRAFEMGNEIANHSMDHKYLARLSKDDIISQISLTNETIEAVTGESPQLLRLPYGSINSRVQEAASELGMPIIGWSVDPSDYRDISPEEICEYVTERIRDGSIILLHDLHLSTADAIEMLVPALLDKGYQFVTVSELFYYNDVEPQPGVNYGYRRITDLFNKRQFRQVVG